VISARRIAATVALAAGVSLAPMVTAATPALAALPCEWAETPGSTSPWNYPLDGVGCVVLDTSSGIRLVAVTNVQPGWTYRVNSWGGPTASKPNRVDIRFENKSTGQRIDFRYEPGKTCVC
jgi:hypothetical protein